MLAFRALLKKGRIKIPKNIKRTSYIRQEKDKPRGHELIPTCKNQFVECVGILHTLGHKEIDESKEYWELVCNELNAWKQIQDI